MGGHSLRGIGDAAVAAGISGLCAVADVEAIGMASVSAKAEA